MYGFTDSPRKEASGSFVHLCQHVECGCMPVLIWAQHSWCTGVAVFLFFLFILTSVCGVCRCHILLLPSRIHPPRIYVSEWSELSGHIFCIRLQHWGPVQSQLEFANTPVLRLQNVKSFVQRMHTNTRNAYWNRWSHRFPHLVNVGETYHVVFSH